MSLTVVTWCVSQQHIQPPLDMQMCLIVQQLSHEGHAQFNMLWTHDRSRAVNTWKRPRPDLTVIQQPISHVMAAVSPA